MTSKEVERMRKAAMKVGAFACYMPKPRKWVLIKISASTTYVGRGADKGWEYPMQHVCHAQFAMAERVVKAHRRRGAGKGKRPYPRVVANLQQEFKSERLALSTFLLRGEELKWSK